MAIKKVRTVNPFTGESTTHTMHQRPHYTQCCLCGKKTKGGNAFCKEHGGRD